jgi:hypothetical protein
MAFSSLLKRLSLFSCVFTVGWGNDCDVLSADQQPTVAERLDAEFGLEKTKANVWVLAQEKRLPKAVADLNEIRQQIVAQKVQLSTHVLQNSLNWRRLQLAERQADRLKSQAGKANEFAAAKKAVEAYRAISTPPQELGGEKETRSALINLIVAIQELQLRSASLSRQITKLESEYTELAADKKVQKVLSENTSGGRLGPAISLNNLRRKLAEYAKSPDADAVPIYLEAGQIRLGAIVNERFPGTFSWDENASHAVVSHAMYQAWSVAPPDAKAKLVAWQTENGQTVKCTQGRLDYLKIGPAVVRDLPVLVLPPEQESIGAIIGPKLVEAFTADCRPAELVLRLKPVEK